MPQEKIDEMVGEWQVYRFGWDEEYVHKMASKYRYTSRCTSSSTRPCRRKRMMKW
jgi:hypothetical protein